nr:inactive LRR receptor-like serine/threonine-protein kinase BIR2 [Tanacetum cinerariifolium]
MPAMPSVSHIMLMMITLTLLSSSVLAQEDRKCLKGIKNSLHDPQSAFAGWDFTNTTPGFICTFSHVGCWNIQQDRVISLQTIGTGLTGLFPTDLRFCKSIETLNFANNNLSGVIPNEICMWLPYLVSLDLSGNQFTGGLPAGLSDCKFLIRVLLNDNKLSGNIPPQFSALSRLITFSVANNRLVGAIPSGLSKFGFVDFYGNKGLCDKPLSKCGRLNTKNLAIIVAAGVFGAAGSLLIGCGVWWWCMTMKRKRGSLGEDWVDKLRRYKLVQVTLFHKPLVKVRLVDLMIATNSFGEESVIVETRTGTMYKAVLRDGSDLVVKRLSPCMIPQRQFSSEMIGLGQVRHPNLTPLLGFCVVASEKLLVYKLMSNGTLSSFLSKQSSLLDWDARFRIGLGAARGFAWLHHGRRPAISHQNVSSKAIFLDDDYEARIVDFGLARLMNSSGFQPNESSFVDGDLGEFGYVAPEYTSTMVPSLKGDVYGFGVVLLELATGRKPTNVIVGEEIFKGDLVDWVTQLSASGQIESVIDSDIRGTGHDEKIVQFMRIGMNCVNPQPKERWSMYQVYEALKSMAQQLGLSEENEEFPLLYDTHNVFV